MGLEFCSKCGNIMVLKEKKGGVGVFICRNCQEIRDAKIEKIEIQERVPIMELDPLMFEGRRHRLF